MIGVIVGLLVVLGAYGNYETEKMSNNVLNDLKSQLSKGIDNDQINGSSIYMERKGLFSYDFQVAIWKESIDPERVTIRANYLTLLRKPMIELHFTDTLSFT